MSALILLMAFYQNCAGVLNSGVQFTNTGDFIKSVPCSTFDQGSGFYSECVDQKNGLLGRLYYLEDRTDGVSQPAVLYTKYGEQLAFNPSTLSSVNVIISRGIPAETYILMPQVAIPEQRFSDGFKLSETEYLQDRNGKKLIEAFALDLIGTLMLPPDQSPGTFEASLISDDGSILDMDFKNDRNYESIILNDGNHAPRVKCSSKFFDLDARSRLPIRLRYYQGPRAIIALTLMLRRVDQPQNQTPGSTDMYCDRDVRGIDFVTELQSRGWFIPTRESFSLPDASRISLLQANE